MKKIFFTLLTAGSLLFANSVTDAQAAQPVQNEISTSQESTVSTIEQVAASKATAKSGTFKTKYTSNVRADAGTKTQVITVAKKGSIATATHQKKVGKSTWYKVKVNGKSGWILSTLLTSTTVKKASVSTSSSAVVSEALALKGIPYKFGGTTTAGFDCSGFIQYAFKQAGKSVSRSTLTQYAESYTVSTPQPGDLVFFANTYRAGISHVGIYIGNNQFVHSGGAKAEVKSMNDPYWGKKFHSFKRF
ncbi:endopeptidase, cell wall lytic activity [Planococcus halocryophilus Or1]|uniref:C40 family peptidase n=1 Tax=Planococcus halocryophilus TaxID=1215089 RepID=UPI0002B89C3F|nr:C40 family peptidase [Planococcus halocryophilus]EMF47428.1 endopeptidase, cell wall lytic activity [Planococcus halocryophilus Or1]